MAIGIKIEDKNKRRITTNDLNKGEIFIYEDIIYMLLTNWSEYGYFHIEKIERDEEYGGRECDKIAVNLLNGALKDFDGSECVSLITKDLVIKINREDINEWM